MSYNRRSARRGPALAGRWRVTRRFAERVLYRSPLLGQRPSTTTAAANL